jgi:uncharacterized membrane protein
VPTPLSPWTRAYLGLVAFSIFGTLASRLTGLDPGWIAPIAALATLAAGLGSVVSEHLRLSRPGMGWWAVASALAIGAGSELVGVSTGLPFGRYEYTEAWWPTMQIPGVGPFPVALPFAWMMMAGSAHLLARRQRRGWAAVAVGGLLAAVADAFMEPAATGSLGYWRWLEPGPLPGAAPLLNPVGWFLTACAAGAVLSRAHRQDAGPPSRDPGLVLAVHTLFMVVVWILGQPATPGVGGP